MPYKDINQQRERSRLAMRILRAKQKGLTTAELTQLTLNGLTKKSRVNRINKSGLTTKTKATNNQFLNSQIFTNLVTEIRNSQQTFLTQMENLIRSELGKFPPPVVKQPSPKSTPPRPKTFSFRNLIKVDIAKLEKATGLKSNWQNPAWKVAWKHEYNRLYNQLIATAEKKRLSRLKNNR